MLIEDPFDAPLAEPAARATPTKAIQMTLIPTPYFSSLSTEVMEISFQTRTHVK